MIKNTLQFKNEHYKYGLLIVLSFITGIIEYIGFKLTNSNTLGISLFHMIFHIVFFGVLFIFSYLRHTKKHIFQQKQIEKITGIGIIIVVVGLGITRAREIMEHGWGSILSDKLALFRIFLIVILILVIVQWYILHIRTKDQSSCNVFCHGSEGHLLIDIVGFTALCIVSFFGNNTIITGADIAVFIASGIILINTVIRILKNIYN